MICDQCDERVEILVEVGEATLCLECVRDAFEMLTEAWQESLQKGD